MKQVTYSFVIPHHNTPKLLNRLINSIPQREDIEIIIVDDNSDDNMKAQVNRPDARVIFVDKEQSRGAGRARNIGMNAAAGKWLLFADADDLYNTNFIDVLDDYKNDDIDALFFNIDSVDSESLKPGKNRRATYQDKLIRQYVYDGSEKSANNMLYFGYGPWRKMLNSSFVKKYGFQFEETSKCNDQLFSLETSYFMKKWKVDNRVVYILTYRVGSLSIGHLSKDKYVAHMKALRRRAEFFKYLGHSEWNLKCVRGFFYQSCLFYCLKMILKEKWKGLKVLLYYISSIKEIRNSAQFYIHEIEKIKVQNNKVIEYGNTKNYC